ncbi:MAG: hypothetical protein M1305_07405 [Candidatus Marsarchaeota archaeon]|nr:hypothetical protein [Candidatus Marsarchaeota archaeon]
MKRITRTTIDGKPVTSLAPETEADLREMERLDKARKLDARLSLGDSDEPKKVRVKRSGATRANRHSRKPVNGKKMA